MYFPKIENLGEFFEAIVEHKKVLNWKNLYFSEFIAIDGHESRAAECFQMQILYLATSHF